MVKKEQFRGKKAGRSTVSSKPLVVPAVVFESRNLTDTISLKNILLFCRESIQVIRDTDGTDQKSVGYFAECIDHLGLKLKKFTKILDWDDKRVFHELVEDGKKIEKLLRSGDSSPKDKNFSIRLYADIAGFEWRVVRLLEQLRLATP